MKTMMLALASLLTCVLAQDRADPPKAPALDVGAGRIAWFDLTTTDLPKSREFYRQVFGWTFTPIEGTDLAVEIVASGTAIGTLRVAEGPISAYNGLVYVQVDDLPASCARSKGLGGTIAPGFPFDLPDGRGAIALVLDPAGHPVGLYSKTPLASAPDPAK